MYFNEMELKVYYEMRKEEMEKAALTSKYRKNKPKAKLFSNFLSMIKKNQQQKQISICCEKINIQKGCCEN
ncbi:hypothetical protein V7266_23095 [Neobacillus drentensis]|uniref:hypothetical protein n=1 Tax=Neobacillus drentensis TaxID=220684 RepID=UPI002FFDC0E3